MAPIAQVVVARLATLAFAGEDLARDMEWNRVMNEYTILCFGYLNQKLHESPRAIRPVSSVCALYSPTNLSLSIHIRMCICSYLHILTKTPSIADSLVHARLLEGTLALEAAAYDPRTVRR